eukprot:07895.XXX_372505_382470_1 [CDS] Oithona nana genome sequencing.
MMNGHSMKSVRLEDLPLDIKALCQHSLDARKASYSPYSQFKVGAALLSEDGKLVTGCNVENASYGLAICAERTACVKAVSEGVKTFSAIAISADLTGDFCGPCGACRQFLSEFNPDLPIYLVRVADEQVKITNLDQLLPDSFTPKRLNLAFHNSAEPTN